MTTFGGPRLREGPRKVHADGLSAKRTDGGLNTQYTHSFQAEYSCDTADRGCCARTCISTCGTDRMLELAIAACVITEISTRQGEVTEVVTHLSCFSVAPL